MDTLNSAYPGCTGVYLPNAGHSVAFYGKKTKPGAGLSLEQGMEACCLVTEIPTWMGSLAKYTVRAISTTEAQELVQGLKRLEKEDFCKVHLELSNKLSSLHLGQTNSSLSASAKPFVPLATSSITATGIPPPGGTTLPLRGPQMPLHPCTPLMMMGSPPMLPHRRRKTGKANEGRTVDIAVLPVTPELVTVDWTLQL